MRSLSDLLATDDGRELLAEHAMLTDVDEFVAQLRPPSSDALTSLLGLAPGARLVHIGQQVCLDYAPSTLAKFAVAPALAQQPDVEVAVLYHDADRAGSERYGMRMVLPAGGRLVGIWLAPRALGDREPRFIPVDRDGVERALEELAAWLTVRSLEQPKDRRQRMTARMTALAAGVRSRCGEAGPETLGHANAAFSDVLLAESVGVSPARTSLSTMLEAGLLDDALDRYLAHVDDVVAVFNESIDDLLAQDVDPHLKRLTPDYLPLHYSCLQDGTRLRLCHERRGADHFATADCRCGAGYRFFLGSGAPTLGELRETGRWSPDVSLPVHHHDQASGWVVGRSTALYGLVLNTVMQRVLGLQPLPGLVPPSLHDGTAAADEGSSVLVGYLTS